MTRWILDSDHVSLFERGHVNVITAVLARSNEVATTVVSAEEILRGRLSVVRRADDRLRVDAYSWLLGSINFLMRLPLLPFDTNANKAYIELRASRVRVGTQDLKIAAIALAHGVVVVTRNRADFERVPNLQVEDWSV